MRKVLVLGCAGSGKSTFSKNLGQIKGVPVIHLDSLYWKSGWVASSEQDWDITIDELLVNHDTYILDGNYSRTLDKRLKDTDTVFYFDFPRYLCIYRVIKRRILNHGKTRADMAEGCIEKIDLEFIRWIWNYKKRSRRKILKTLDEVGRFKMVYIFKKPRDVKEYMNKYL
ncbi:MAG: AAA family ATPase [Paenibacillaceae bacterium]